MVSILLAERDTTRIIVKDQMESVILFEVMIFFYSIFAQMLFLLLSRFASFQTIKERLELGGNMRYRRDFLEHVKEDVHYLIIGLVELFLYIYVITHLQSEQGSADTLDKILIGVHIAMQFILVFLVYFKKNQMRSKVTPFIKGYVFITLILIVYLLYPLATDRITWWPYEIHYAVVQICMFVNICCELYRFQKSVDSWKREFLVMRALN